MNHDIDTAMMEDLVEAFSPASYNRATTTFSPPSRAPMMVGTGIVASLAATALLIGGEGARSPALAWSAAPVPATPAQSSDATQLCVPPGRELPGYPSELPGPRSFDIYGDAGFAVFEVDGSTITCLARVGDDGVAPLVGTVVPQVAPSGATLDIASCGSWRLDETGSGSIGFSGQTAAAWTADLADLPEFTFVAGRARADVAELKVEVPGHGDAQVGIVDGFFVAWWPGSPDEVTAHPLNAAGQELGAISVCDSLSDQTNG